MVYFSDVQLDRAFAALADPTRRAILDRLARDRELAMTQIAVCPTHGSASPGPGTRPWHTIASRAASKRWA